MSLRYIQHVFTDPNYYINNCYEYNDLIKISKDIENAKQELAELENLIYNQIQNASRVIKYREIIARRRKLYKGNIELYVYVNEYSTLDGARLKKENMVYGTQKTFRGNEKKQAIEYANELKSKHHLTIIYDNWK